MKSDAQDWLVDCRLDLHSMPYGRVRHEAKQELERMFLESRTIVHKHCRQCGAPSAQGFSVSDGYVPVLIAHGNLCYGCAKRAFDELVIQAPQGLLSKTNRRFA